MPTAATPGHRARGTLYGHGLQGSGDEIQSDAVHNGTVWINATVYENAGIDNVTTIEHDGAGNPTAIIGPFGQITTLAVDTNGFLKSVSNPELSIKPPSARNSRFPCSESLLAE